MNYKIYSGAGNDFVMINNLDKIVPLEKQKEFSAKICEEKFKQIDGVIFLEKPLHEENAIRMNYYNRDGSYGAMCGNGARCIAQFAIDENILDVKTFNLEAVDKVYKAEIPENNIVKIFFPPPKLFELNIEIERVNGLDTVIANYMQVGSDHLVIFIKDRPNFSVFQAQSLDNININLSGSLLRYHPKFQPAGANVNFVEILSVNELRVRTYERGVERETLACGTGIISSALVSALQNRTKPPIKVLSQSGEWLEVDFKIDKNEISNLSLKGSAKKIGEGEI
jgi:diaminopimelate epimerase